MKKILLLSICIFLNMQVKAQDDGLEAILLSGVDDANKLTEAYVNPAMKGLIYSMNGGWYHTAATHKTFGFDFTFGLNASIVPKADEIFKFSDLNLTPGTTSTSPIGATIAGTNTLEPVININREIDKKQVSASFTMPAGVKEDLPLNAMPAPAVQFSLGLPKSTEIMLRLVPEVGDTDVKGSLLGIGVKKEITSLFGTFDKLPLHVSILGAYTTMDVNYNIQNDSSINGSNQEAVFELKAYTVQAIASLNFPIINFYGGIGYSGGSSTFKMKGTYELEYNTNDPAPNDTKTETLTDPINLKFDATGIKATLGTRLSLGFFKIFADYSLQEYNTATAGIAFSFR
ncbi:MAG: hypothetical protein KBE41_12900 [Lutibacter sp.]|nr:hypothetical protein [Lutibacter sp.]